MVTRDTIIQSEWAMMNLDGLKIGSMEAFLEEPGRRRQTRKVMRFYNAFLGTTDNCGNVAFIPKRLQPSETPG